MQIWPEGFAILVLKSKKPFVLHPETHLFSILKPKYRQFIVNLVYLISR